MREQTKKVFDSLESEPTNKKENAEKEKLLKEAWMNWLKFWIQLDESIDLCDTAELAVCKRMGLKDFSVKEELIKLLLMDGQTKEEDTFNT
ncbi:hypothetical protein NPIL_313301 [Nephila pilipes]|uniref:Uncharacterized protein n=1 Tax=Nephila pilipes TaxID=299642 RepID=A0A8X6N729_NEPPI|nr:hypothetical protein NPIL_313301 [Nephila pilipes]